MLENEVKEILFYKFKIYDYGSTISVYLTLFLGTKLLRSDSTNFILPHVNLKQDILIPYTPLEKSCSLPYKKCSFHFQIFTCSLKTSNGLCPLHTIVPETKIALEIFDGKCSIAYERDAPPHPWPTNIT